MAVETDVGETISVAKVACVCGLWSVGAVALLSAGPFFLLKQSCHIRTNFTKLVSPRDIGEGAVAAAEEVAAAVAIALKVGGGGGGVILVVVVTH